MELISTHEARMIAYEWHGGQFSPLYMFASSGNIPDLYSLQREIAECVNYAMTDHSLDDQAREDIMALQDYVESLDEDTDQDIED